MRKTIAIILVLVICLQFVGCSVVDSAKDTADMVGKKADQIIEETTEEIGKAFDAASAAVSQLSIPDFKKGFDTAAGYFGTTVAALGGQSYVDDVASAINELQQRLTNRISTNGTVASQAGYAAEEWHAGTYNIDAVARGSNAFADTPKSNELGSPDVVAGDKEASLKYYKDAQASATQQAKNYLQKYGEYKSKTSNPKPIEEWLEDNNVSMDTDLKDCIYKEQLRIIPSDQLKDAKKQLEKAIENESSKESNSRHYLGEADLKILHKLKDRLETDDGTKSVPLSKAEAEAIVKAARDGDLDIEKFGITIDSSVKGTYIAKQALKSGATAAMIEVAIVLGPEIYEIIKLGIESGELDEKRIKQAGMEGLTVAGDGYLKGSVSNALVILCQAGKLGSDFVNASPELIGTLTVLVIDAVRYGIMLGNGKMTIEQYIDTMAEEVFISAGALGTAALIGMLFPGATLAIMLGSFVGSLVISAGYTTGKTFVLAWIEETDIDLLVPIKETSNAIKDLTASLSMKVTDAIASLKAVTDNTYKKVTIMVYDFTDRI